MGNKNDDVSWKGKSFQVNQIVLYSTSEDIYIIHAVNVYCRRDNI